MEDLKRRYIDMRNKKVFEIGFFFDYAIHRGFTGDFMDFSNAFRFIDLQRLLPQLDKEYNLCTLFDCEDNFIRVVENPV